jgi:Ca-activated chloride channel homolog
MGAFSVFSSPRVLLLTICVATGAAIAAQQAVFRGGNLTIPVYATVLGADGRLVSDLAQRDFEVFDNGKPQEITVFSNDLQPITVVLLLDRSGSVVRDFDLVRDAAGQFVANLLPGDKARIGSFADRVQLDPATFTGDQNEMRRILDTELQDPGPTPLWNAVAVGMTALLHVEGRRVVLVFTDGADDPGRETAANVTLRELLQRVREEDVMVYAVGLTGHSGFGGRGRSGSGGFGAGPGFGGFRTGPGPDAGLAELAAQSGGGHFVLTSARDLGATFAHVADELHHQYALGFTPSSRDGKTHQLDVRTKAAGTTVRARTSYVAPKQPRQ